MSERTSSTAKSSSFDDGFVLPGHYGMDFTAPGIGWSNGDIPPQLYPMTHEGRLQIYGSNRRWIGVNAGWTRIGDGHEHDRLHSSSQSLRPVVETPEHEGQTIRSLIAQLCESFYNLGSATGTAGGVSIRVGGPEEDRPWRVFVAPSGIQKEDMIGDDVFELDMEGRIVVPPLTPGLRLSGCTPLWYVVYDERPSAKCVVHTHSLHAQMATLLDTTEESTVFRMTHHEMLKGVGHHAYDDMLEVPIIDNKPTENMLADSLREAIRAYPKSNAVLVRRHGVFVWGDSWEQAKTQCESFECLFKAAFVMKTQLGIDPCKVPTKSAVKKNEMAVPRAGLLTNRNPSTGKESGDSVGFQATKAEQNQEDFHQDCATVPLLPRDAQILLLDIEGCTTSIAFVKKILFPYSRKHFPAYLAGLDSKEIYDLTAKLWTEVQVYNQNHNVPHDALALLIYLMDHDVKSATLKELQGKIWKEGYEMGSLKGHVYPDFLPMLQWMKQQDVKVYIYSSGSVQAQKLLFSHTKSGDLLSYLSGHFDIVTAGEKKEATSYQQIAGQLGVDISEIVFCSDSVAELEAARQAGMSHTIMTIRPGNAPLANNNRDYPCIFSLLQLCGSNCI